MKTSWVTPLAILLIAFVISPSMAPAQDNHIHRYCAPRCGLASPYAGTMTALAWYPKRFGVRDGFRMGNYNLAVIAVENLAPEFLYGWPHSMISQVGTFGWERAGSESVGYP